MAVSTVEMRYNICKNPERCKRRSKMSQVFDTSLKNIVIFIFLLDFSFLSAYITP